MWLFLCIVATLVGRLALLIHRKGSETTSNGRVESLSSAPRIHLGTKNEWVTFVRDGLRCELDCILNSDERRWDVYVDNKCHVNGELRPLSAVERREVLPAVERYLQRVWWLGVFPRRYSVRFHDSDDA